MNHIAFSFNLEVMEPLVLQHVKRVLNGLPLYPEPSSEFVALSYNPLYYYLCIPFVWLFGANLFTLRLVAILGMLGSGLVIFLEVHRATSSKWWGLMAIGLFAAAYRVMDTYLDNAFPESWMLFTVLLGCYLIDQSRLKSRNFAGVFLLVIAYWFKQPGAIFAVGGVIYLTWRDGGRKSWPLWLLAAALGPGLYFAAPPWLFGPRFHYFTWEVPRQWIQFDTHNILRVMKLLVTSYLILATIGFITSASALLRLRSREINIWYFMFPMAAISALPGLLDPESANNLYILLGVWIIITGIQGLKQLVDLFSLVQRHSLHLLTLIVSYALLFYNPMLVIVSSQAVGAYQDMVSYLKSLNGSIYAPWTGQLQDDYRFYPTAHWVPMDDMIRGPGRNVHNHPNIRTLLEPVLLPKGKAFILMPFPLENDPMLDFLKKEYVLDTDLGERFVSLSPLPKRYNPGYPRYLYRYAPQEAAYQAQNSFHHSVTKR
ncbi:MAG: hypothetical protein HXY24_10525 [Rubrivivax sp.]|nr:hypothetical protein [Rubrivivax sp.]